MILSLRVNFVVFFIVYWLPVLMWAGVIFYLSSVPALGTGLPWLWDLLLRKLGHITEYAILMYLLGRALRAQGLALRHVLILSTLLALAYAVGDEYHQSLVAGRVGSVKDVAIDGIGMLAALLYLGRRAASQPLAQGPLDK